MRRVQLCKGRGRSSYYLQVPWRKRHPGKSNPSLQGMPQQSTQRNKFQSKIKGVMESIAKWMGYTEAIYYTGRMAYFIKKRSEMVFISEKKDFNPRINPAQFSDVMDRFLKQGGSVNVEKIYSKTSRYINVRARLEIDHKIMTHTGQSYKHAIIKCINEYVEKTELVNE